MRYFYFLFLFPFITSAAPSPTIDPSTLISIIFYYDENISGKQDTGEPILNNLKIIASGYSLHESDGSLKTPKNQTIKFQISGKSPSGKALTNVTSEEPNVVLMLPDFSYRIGTNNAAIGLADGFLTSPLRPENLNLDDYNAVLNDSKKWEMQSDPLYPKGWSYPKNYFFYGYRIPEGGLKGTPHLAFDIWAKPGTPVYASIPGTIVQPLYDWQFGINGAFGTVYYNHIVPAVSIGVKVARYDLVGYIAEDQGNHVHFELRPDPEKILWAFPGVRAEYFLKSPQNGEAVPVPPYFGE